LIFPWFNDDLDRQWADLEAHRRYHAGQQAMVDQFRSHNYFIRALATAYISLTKDEPIRTAFRPDLR
jgi:hypothetical protein